ncbi:MAG: hypothetical protein BJ554DRAFT_3530, partial [Olpidium bornovanus]
AARKSPAQRIHAVAASVATYEGASGAVEKAAALQGGPPEYVFCCAGEDLRSADASTEPTAAHGRRNRARAAARRYVAGLARPMTFLDQTVKNFEEVMQVNYFGSLYTIKVRTGRFGSPLRLTPARAPQKPASAPVRPEDSRVLAVQAAVHKMVEQNIRGRVLVTGSVAGFMGMFGYADYAPTKHALRDIADRGARTWAELGAILAGLAECLRNELLMYGIKVHYYAPNTILSPGFEVEVGPFFFRYAPGRNPLRFPRGTSRLSGRSQLRRESGDLNLNAVDVSSPSNKQSPRSQRILRAQVPFFETLLTFQCGMPLFTVAGGRFWASRVDFLCCAADGMTPDQCADGLLKGTWHVAAVRIDERGGAFNRLGRNEFLITTDIVGDVFRCTMTGERTEDERPDRLNAPAGKAFTNNFPLSSVPSLALFSPRFLPGLSPQNNVIVDAVLAAAAWLPVVLRYVGRLVARQLDDFPDHSGSRQDVHGPRRVERGQEAQGETAAEEGELTIDSSSGRLRSKIPQSPGLCGRSGAEGSSRQCCSDPRADQHRAGGGKQQRNVVPWKQGPRKRAYWRSSGRGGAAAPPRSDRHRLGGKGGGSGARGPGGGPEWGAKEWRNPQETSGSLPDSLPAVPCGRGVGDGRRRCARSRFWHPRCVRQEVRGRTGFSSGTTLRKEADPPPTPRPPSFPASPSVPSFPPLPPHMVRSLDGDAASSAASSAAAAAQEQRAREDGKGLQDQRDEEEVKAEDGGGGDDADDDGEDARWRPKGSAAGDALRERPPPPWDLLEESNFLRLCCRGRR